MVCVTITIYKTRRSMPEDLRATAKNCSKCHGWFSPERFERVCLACLSPSQRALRASRYNHTGAPKNVTDVAAQRHTGPPTPGTKEWMLAITRRNVSLGLQGACDLERYR